jgi:pimeloyl-ACP methyl ester carboxylesterase
MFQPSKNYLAAIITIMALWPAYTDAAVIAVSSSSAVDERVVTVDKVKLHYVESGSGEQTVVLIHGNAGNAADFEFGVIERLASSYHVLAFDRPGHGSSERGDHMSAVERQARLIHDSLVQLGIRRPILVGHSWGGSLALAYGLEYPQEVSGLVLLAPAAYPEKLSFWFKAATKVPVIGELGALLGRSIFCRDLVKHEIANAFYPQRVPDGYLQIVRRTWLGRRQVKAYFADEANLYRSLSGMSDRYSTIGLPTIIVAGDADKVVDSSENAYRLHDTIRGSRLVRLKDMGHEIPQTHPEIVADAVNSILKAQEQILSFGIK